jgi:hypothetical protein
VDVNDRFDADLFLGYVFKEKIVTPHEVEERTG